LTRLFTARSYNQIYNNIGGEDRAQAQAFITRGYGMTARRKVLQRYSLTMKPAFPRRPLTCSKDCTPVLKQGSLLAYLVSMMLRITEIHRVLKPTGSFYLHCDPTASHYLKLILNSIFVANGGDFRMKSSGIT
jgi:site-specific DNA-methyltransferase (adenine-specific)